VATPFPQFEGKYEIITKLKEGGMGAVYKVRHRLLDEVRVIKLIRPQLESDEGIRARFLRALPEHDYAGVLVALAVGDQRAIDGGLWQLFARTGITHLMSISGLHVTMVAALGAWLGWQMLPVIVLLSSVVGAAIGIGLIVFKGRDHNVPLAFGPYLAVAGAIGLFFGPTLVRLFFPY